MSPAERSKAQEAMGTSLQLLCRAIDEALKANRLQGIALDFRHVHFFGCSLAGTTLARSDFGNATLEQVDLEDTALLSVSGFEGSSWPGSNWWDAKAIDGGLLAYLVANQYPFSDPDAFFRAGPPDAKAYRARVETLCKGAGIVCPNPKFGPQAPAELTALVGKVSPGLGTYIAEHDYSGSTTTFSARPSDDETRSLNELVQVGLCKELDSAALRSQEKAEKAKPGSALRGVDCGDDYGNVREALIAQIRPEFLVRLSLAGGDPTKDAVLAKATQIVRDALPGLSAGALRLVLDGTPGSAEWVYTRPGRNQTEQAALDRLVSAGLCTVDDSDELRASEKPGCG
jgi:hypothetical protein